MTPTTLDGKHGIDVLRDPELNKSTAFTEAEKEALGLVGLVPDVTEGEDVQLQRVLMHLGNTCYRCISMRVLTMSSICTTRSTWECVRPARRQRSFSLLSTNSWTRCRKCFRSAAFTLRIGRERMLSICFSATAISTAFTTTMCRARLGSLSRE